MMAIKIKINKNIIYSANQLIFLLMVCKFRVIFEKYKSDL